jgi:hypothetical protein
MWVQVVTALPEGTQGVGIACIDAVSREIIKKWYAKIDSHGCIEAHLPGYLSVELIERTVLPASMLKGNLLEVLKGWETSKGPLLNRVVPLDLPFSRYRSVVIRWQHQYFESCSMAASPTPGTGLNSIVDAFTFSLPEPGS